MDIDGRAPLLRCGGRSGGGTEGGVPPPREHTGEAAGLAEGGPAAVQGDGDAETGDGGAAGEHAGGGGAAAGGTEVAGRDGDCRTTAGKRVADVEVFAADYPAGGGEHVGVGGGTDGGWGVRDELPRAAGANRHGGDAEREGQRAVRLVGVGSGVSHPAGVELQPGGGLGVFRDRHEGRRAGADAAGRGPARRGGGVDADEPVRLPVERDERGGVEGGDFGPGGPVRPAAGNHGGFCQGVEWRADS